VYRSTTSSWVRRLVVAPVALLLAASVVAGCGSHGDRTGGRASSEADSAAGGSLDRVGNTGNAQAPSSAARAADAASVSKAEVERRAVISTGDVELVSDDVSATRAKVDAVLAQLGGHVADENTTTDDRGTVRRTHLVVRVPSRRFDEAMRDLSDTASLRSSSRQAEDVTTRVIDLGARIAAERAGVHRLRQLVSSTADLRALLDVERALTQRQGRLESLRQQQAYLADQTSQASITVDVTRMTAVAPAQASGGGFVAGLRHGWHALLSVVVALLVALGAVLPFAVVIGVLGLPGWALLRRALRSRRLRTSAES
jgi:hypothetical protein